MVYLYYIYMKRVGGNNSFGIATRYGLDVPTIESRWGQDSPQSSSPVLGPTIPPIKCAPRLFPGGKAAGE